MPAHYRYLAIPIESFDLAIGELTHFGLFPEDGIGASALLLSGTRARNLPRPKIAVAPERFRVDPKAQEY